MRVIYRKAGDVFLERISQRTTAVIAYQHIWAFDREAGKVAVSQQKLRVYEVLSTTAIYNNHRKMVRTGEERRFEVMSAEWEGQNRVIDSRDAKFVFDIVPQHLTLSSIGSRCRRTAALPSPGPLHDI